MQTWGHFIGGTWRLRAPYIDVRNPFDGKAVGLVSKGTPADVADAVAAAEAALDTPFPPHARYDVLMAAAALIDRDQEAYARTIASEGSKSIREARREPPRAANILRLAAEEGRRLAGETLPFGTRPGSENRVGYFERVPAGVVAAILPFNDPMAVATHKVGPALAGGNAVVLKPDSATPLSVLMMAGALEEAGLPPGRLNVVTGHGSDFGDALVSDPRVRVVAFTGGVRTGERITRTAGIKKLMLELGANSPVIVLADADLDRAVPAVADGAFTQAGQNCLGVQRVLLEDGIYDAFRDRFVAHTATLTAGSSLDEATDVCAMIREQEAKRVEAWVEAAVTKGARVAVGHRREGAVYWPTVLEDVPAGVQVDCEEVYGPVVSLYRVASLDEAIRRANAVAYGLHAAIFTESLRSAFTAIERLRAGAVLVNDSTDYRLDAMPFGGMKNSGIGREGIRHALHEMTEPRVVCLNLG
jgi:glyceraldehyde-3-phosphate dehydrogenase (NADP+)